MSFSTIDPNGRVDLDSLSSLQEWYSAHGYIPKPADISASLDPSFTAYALGVLGTYE